MKSLSEFVIPDSPLNWGFAMKRYTVLLLIAVLLALTALAASAAGNVSPLGTEFRVNDLVGQDTWLHAVDMDANGDAVVFMWGGFAGSLDVRLYTPAGAPKGPQFAVTDGNLGDPRDGDAAMDADGNFVVVWGGPYARLYHGDGTPRGAAFVVATANNARPTVAMDDDGDFVVVWVPFAGQQVSAQRYAADGSPRSGVIIVADTSGTDVRLRYADVALDADGDFIVSWSYYDGDDNCGGKMQRFSAAGTPQGAVIDMPSCYEQQVVMDADGDFAAVWPATVNGEHGIYARRFLANGQPNGAAFLVNTSTGDRLYEPAAAMNDAGDLFITWTRHYRNQRKQWEAGREIYGRRFAANGVPLGDEFKVSTYPGGNPFHSRVALDNQGDSLAVWMSAEQDGSGYGVYGQYNDPVIPPVPVLISLARDGKVRGMSYKAGDVVQYDPAADTWSIYWAAAAHGLGKANIGDFEVLDDGDLLLIFKAPTNVPGVGMVQPQDIARFDVATNAYSLYFDGSDVGLATLAEKLDALGMEADGALLLSTTGSFNVAGVSGVDEDLIRFQPTMLGPNTAGNWSPVLTGTSWDQPKDVLSLWVDTVSPDTYYYMTVERSFRLQNGTNTLVPNGGIVRCRPIGSNGCLLDLYWSGAAHGLPATAKIDGLELVTAE